jgi:hypothetical protein
MSDAISKQNSKQCEQFRFGIALLLFFFGQEQTWLYNMVSKYTEIVLAVLSL